MTGAQKAARLEQSFERPRSMTQYSFTEKKRIRKSFAKRASVLPVPFLLETQLASYRAFLQAGTPPDTRKNEGLQAAFTSIFPLSSHSGNARLEFVGYSLLAPAFDVTECQQRGLTYCSALRAKVRLTIMVEEATKPTVKEVKEQEVYMGEIPLMTGDGSFVINGTERVIVAQLQRSRGDVARFDVLGKDCKVVIPRDKRITARHVREMVEGGVKRITVPTDYVVGRALATNIVDTNTGEVLAKANDEITDELLQKLIDAEV